MRLALAMLLLALAARPEIASARAQAIRCGMVVEDQAILDRDLRCEGTAVVLRNPLSTLQLNGHTVESRRSCAEGAALSGIAIEHTADGAQILGPGLVRGFVTGIPDTPQAAGARVATWPRRSAIVTNQSAIMWRASWRERPD